MSLYPARSILIIKHDFRSDYWCYDFGQTQKPQANVSKIRAATLLILKFIETVTNMSNKESEIKKIYYILYNSKYLMEKQRKNYNNNNIKIMRCIIKKNYTGI